MIAEKKISCKIYSLHIDYIDSCKHAKRMTHSFPGFMTEKMARKLSGLVIYLYLKDGAFTAVRGTICQ